MKEDEKILLNDWKEVMKEFLNPLDLIEKLPSSFEFGSENYRRIVSKRNEPHVAVEIVVEIVIETNMPFREFIGGVRSSGHAWLAELICGHIADQDVEKAAKEREEEKYVRKFLSIIAPQIKEIINGKDVAGYLQSYDYGELITPGELERVAQVSREEGNQASVRTLLMILTRKPSGWLLHFTDVLVALNYSADLVDSLKGVCSFPYAQYASSDIERESQQKAFAHEKSESNYKPSDLVREPTGVRKMPYGGSETSHNSTCRQSKSDASDWTQNEIMGTLVEEDIFEEHNEKPNDAVRIHGLLGADHLPTNNVIPKEGQVNKYGIRNMEPVYGEDSLPPGQQNEVLVTSLEEDLFEERAGKVNDAVSMHELNDTASLPVPTNNVIPQKAQMTKYVVRSRKSVRGEDSLPPEDRQLARTISVGNVVFCTPESNDRSRMIVHIIKSRFPHILNSKDPKIAVVVSKISSHDVFKTSFASRQWKVALCDENNARQLNVAMNSHQVVVVTAEALLNWLCQDSDVHRIFEFDMLVIDECDNALSDGPLRKIMKTYHDEKQTREAQVLPQIIGLFSSVKSKNKLDALKCTKTVCALLDATGGIEVQIDDQASKPKRSIKSGSQKSNSNNFTRDLFTFHLCNAMDEIVNEALDILCNHTRKELHRPHDIIKGSDEYTEWCRKLVEDIGCSNDSPAKRDFTCCAIALQAFNDAVFIKARCRVEDALAILEEKREQLFSDYSRKAAKAAEKRVHGTFAKTLEKLKLCIRDETVANISLYDIEKKLQAQFKKKKSSRAILMINDRRLISPMKDWLQSIHISDNFCMCLEDRYNGQRNRKIIADFNSSGGMIMVCMANAWESTIQCDLALLYGCDMPGANMITRNQLPTYESIFPQIVAADKRVKIKKSLLMRIVVDEIQESRQQDKNKYIEELKKIQSQIFGSRLESHRTRSSRHEAV